VLWLIVIVFALSLVLTWQLRRVAIAAGTMDRPNARSSHTILIPRGGGLSVVIVTILSTMLLWCVDVVGVHLALAMCGGGVAIAMVEYMDDRGSLVISTSVTHLRQASTEYLFA
jgi:Fuc2NAc and GlcNAc transferase